MNTQTLPEIKFQFIESGKKLSDNFCLSHEALIFVPTTYDVDKQLPAVLIESVVESIRHLCAIRFGGANNETAREGSWVSDDKRMVDEKNIVVHVLFGELTPEVDTWFGNLADSIKESLSQESVLIVIHNVLGYFA